MSSDLVADENFDSSLMIQLRHHLLLPQAARKAAIGLTALLCAYLALHMNPSRAAAVAGSLLFLIICTGPGTE